MRRFGRSRADQAPPDSVCERRPARGSSRHHIIRACEASLRRLGTDYLDLYQVHSVDEHTALDETLTALDDLVRSGKVRYVDCSNYTGTRLIKALAVSEHRGLVRFASL